MRCERCGRFIGEDCAEGVDWSRGMQQDGDVAWTGKFYCANGVGCNRFEEDEVADRVLALGPDRQRDGQGADPNG